MNMKNNKRKQLTRAKIKHAYLSLTHQKRREKITIREICETAKINRTTFYDHYLDIFDLTDAINDDMLQHIEALLNDAKKNGHPFFPLLLTRLFSFIEANSDFYRVAFQRNKNVSMFTFSDFLPFKTYLVTIGKKITSQSEAEIAYHLNFFLAGFDATVRLWVKSDCQQSPAEMSEIIQNEYKKNFFFYD